MADKEEKKMKKKRRDDALKEGQELYKYACQIKKRVERNKKYIEQEMTRNKDFVKLNSAIMIVRFMNLT